MSDMLLYERLRSRLRDLLFMESANVKDRRTDTITTGERPRSLRGRLLWPTLVLEHDGFDMLVVEEHRLTGKQRMEHVVFPDEIPERLSTDDGGDDAGA